MLVIRKVFQMLIPVILLFTLVPNIAQAASEQISVQLKYHVSNVTQLTFTVKGPYLLNDATPLAEGKTYTVKLENGTLSLYDGTNKMGANGIFKVTPVAYGTNSYVTVNGRPYLGTMEFTISGDYIRPINTLDFEDYLKGVLPGEVFTTWDAEALKAQAIAARSYALYKINSGKVIDDTVSTQRYDGFIWNSSAYNSMNKAVEDTAGRVLKYKGAVVEAVYSARNGGFIESNKNVWGGTQLPYYQARPDPYDPEFTWDVKLTKQQINTTGLDLTRPESWWNNTTEAQVNESQFKNIKNHLATKNGVSVNNIKIKGITQVAFPDEFTKTATGENTPYRTKGSLQVEYFMKDASGNFLRNHEDLPSDYATILKGDDRYLTSVAISRAGWKTTSDVVVLGRGDNHVDAITGAVLAKKYNAPLLLTKPNEIPEAVFARIQELQPKKIYLLGGEAAISPSIQDQLEKAGYLVERVSGETRYDTSVQIARAVSNFTEVFVTSGTNTSPDALSIASYAASQQIPIILANANFISDQTIKMIQEKQIKKVTIIGGASAVTEAVVNQLKAAGATTIDRVSGEDRYQTSIAIANRYSFDTSKVYFAQGRTFIDALPGAVLASMENSPVLLTEKDYLPPVTKQWITSLDSRPGIVYLGGDAAISASAREQIKAALLGDLKTNVYTLDEVSIGTIRSIFGGTLFKSAYVTTVQDTGTVFIINGRGDGHGIGMSQRGAQNMVTLGFTVEEILNHYYPGTTNN